MSKKTLTSPVHYLQQNDLVYAVPNYAKDQYAAFNPNTGLLYSVWIIGNHPIAIMDNYHINDQFNANEAVINIC